MRILIADKHALVRELLGAYLESKARAECLSVGSLSEVLERGAHIGPFDFLFLDYEMPSLNGLEGLIAALDAKVATKVVLLSAETREAVVRGAIDRGASGCVTKAMSPADLWQAVKKMASGEIVIPESVMRDASVGERQGKFLSKRETEVLSCICQGLSNKEIARELDLQEVTIKLHVRTLCRKLSARNRTHAAMIAKESGLV